MDEVWSVKEIGLKNTIQELFEISSFIRQVAPKLKTVPNEAFFWSGKTDWIGGELVANVTKIIIIDPKTKIERIILIR
ncbi:hypothetical protein [Flavobacterium sp. JP2137]|uniref:hypothetical protein n=1 Tax=Flavobacterium sp. JP2137 TaxID=3414510 RepID=UPI003D2FBB3B